MRKPRVVLVGATGAVGRVFLNVLEERRFPIEHLKVSASTRSVGVKLPFNGSELVVEETTKNIFEGADITFISVSGSISRELAPLAVEAGSVVIDNSSAFRMMPDVPLIVPEINAEDLDHHNGIVSIPNYSTIQMVMALYPLHQANPVTRVIVDTYQSVSGTGSAAIAELEQQSLAVLDGEKPTPKQYPHQIAFNVLPHIEPFRVAGYTKEEWKMLEETRKIMHAPDILVSATCVRVPVIIGHSEAIHVEFSNPMTPQQAHQLLSRFAGVRVLDDPENYTYPLPINVAETDDVLVGRIRKDASHPNGLAMWVVANNLRKGAATNGVQIAEEILRRNLFMRQSQQV